MHAIMEIESNIAPVTIRDARCLIKADRPDSGSLPMHEIVLQRDRDSIATATIKTVYTNGSLNQRSAKLTNDLKRSCQGKQTVYRKLCGEIWKPKHGPAPRLNIRFSPGKQQPLIHACQAIEENNELWELQTVLSGVNLHTFQRALNANLDRQCVARQQIQLTLTKKLFFAVFDLHKHFAHGDLKPENIVVCYPKDRNIIRDLQLVLENGNNPDAFINRLDIAFIDLDYARPCDSKRSYPANGANIEDADGHTHIKRWNPIGTGQTEERKDSAHIEYWILGAMILSLMVEADYQSGFLMNAVNNPNYHDTIQQRINGVANEPIKNLIRDLMLQDCVQRESFILKTRRYGLLTAEEFKHLFSEKLQQTELDNEQLQVVKDIIRRLVNQAGEPTPQVNERYSQIHTGPLITHSKLLSMIPTNILERLGPDILKELPLDELPPEEAHRLACLYDRDSFSNMNRNFWTTIGIVALSSLGLSGITMAGSVLAALVIGISLSAVCMPIAGIAQAVAVFAILLTAIIKSCLQKKERGEIRKIKASIFHPTNPRAKSKIYRIQSSNPIQTNLRRSRSETVHTRPTHRKVKRRNRGVST